MEPSATVPLLGLIGHKVAGNPMQFAMEQALRAANLDWRFLSFDITPERFADAIRGVDVLGFCGLSIANPYGNQAKNVISLTTPIAAATGWIDVLSRDDQGQLIGHHLMGQVVCDLVEPSQLAEAPVAVLGNAPKTIALAHAFLVAGCQKLVVPQATAEQLAMLGPERASTEMTEEIESQLVALIRGSNVTSQGDEPASYREKEIERLGSKCIVIDQAVPASTTPLLRYAAEQGHHTHSFIDLLVLRAASAFSMWTGQNVDPAPLREAFEEFLEI